jgi:hypothetical protein
MHMQASGSVASPYVVAMKMGKTSFLLTSCACPLLL